METVLVVLTISAPVLVVLSAWALNSRHKRDRRGIRKTRLEQLIEVSIVASIDAPNRNLSATLPCRSQASAEADRLFGYERIRDPSFRPDVDDLLAHQLRPMQIVRVRDRSERKALTERVPPHMNVVFVEDDVPSATVTAPLPQRPGVDR